MLPCYSQFLNLGLLFARRFSPESGWKICFFEGRLNRSINFHEIQDFFFLRFSVNDMLPLRGKKALKIFWKKKKINKAVLEKVLLIFSNIHSTQSKPN